MTEENKKAINETIAKLKELKIESEKIEKNIEAKIKEDSKSKFDESMNKFSSMTTKFFKKAESKITFVANDIVKETKTAFSSKNAEGEFDISKITSLIDEVNKKIADVNAKMNTEEFKKDSTKVLNEAQNVTVFIEGKIDDIQSIINHIK